MKSNHDEGLGRRRPYPPPHSHFFARALLPQQEHESTERDVRPPFVFCLFVLPGFCVLVDTQHPGFPALLSEEF